jgi:hypothetical protein
MEQAVNYQVFATARNAEIKKHLSQNLNNLAVVNQPKEIVPQPKPERIIWAGLLGVSLLTICGLLTKLKLNYQKKRASRTSGKMAIERS